MNSVIPCGKRDECNWPACPQDCLGRPGAKVHCWENGPETEDGCGTTCMLEDGHEGEHQWTQDDQITVSFEQKPL